MWEKFSNIFRIPDLRNRLLFTLAMLAVYRLGAHIPTPGVDTKALESFFDSQSGSALGLVDLFSGGNLRRLTVFALGIMPYITASIIFQLLTVVYEPLAKLQKEGEIGRRKITQWTRYMTVVLGVVQSFAIALTLSHSTGGGQSYVLNPGAGFVAMTVLTLTAGTTFVMWLGEQITDRGVGNGMSLLIFAGIVDGLPRGIADLYEKAKTQAFGAFTVPALAILVIRHDRRRRLHRLCRAIGAAHPGAVREAHRGPTPDGWPVHAPAAESKLRRRHADHLCQLYPVRADAVCYVELRAQPHRAQPHL